MDSSRFRGTCYRAANWICVGETTGRGRMDRQHQAHNPSKLIFLPPYTAIAESYPLNHPVNKYLLELARPLQG